MRRLFTIATVCLFATVDARADQWPAADTYLSIRGCEGTKDPDQCNYTRKTWAKDYKGAISGDYQGQRNVSYCLSTGCSDAIAQNKILGCAWRIVIIDTGHLSLDQSDTANLKYFCGKEQVDETSLRAAQAQARVILQNIPKKRKLK